jgi:MFS family permease
VYFFKACILGSAVAIVLKIVTGNIAGSATMIVNMGGQVAGFISPVVMGYLVSVFNGSFNAVFYYLIGAASVCALSAFLIPERKEAMLDLGEGSEE